MENNFKEYNDAKKEDQLFERIESFEKIKNPDELFLYMKNNIKYGFVGRNNKKIYSSSDSDWGLGDFPKEEYYLQSPKELLQSKHGLCWDQTELERFWFSKNNYNFKTFVLMFDDELSRERPAHTFLVYESDGKWNWFENSLSKEINGVKQFDNFEDLIQNVKSDILGGLIKNKDDKNIEEPSLYEYSLPNYGCGVEEFMYNIIKNVK